jgi:hypothetical protein
MICKHYDGTIEAYDFWYSLKWTRSASIDWKTISSPYTNTSDFMPLQFFLDLPKQEQIVDSVVEADVDPLLSRARELMQSRGYISRTMLRSELGIGYSRADKLVNLLS